MITSKDNDKLTLIRKLSQRKHRERTGLFVAEGEDLLEAGLAAGLEPRSVLVAAGAQLEGDQVEPDLLASVSTLGSGTRAISVWEQRLAAPSAAVCVYLHGVGDPGNVGAVIRTTHALVSGTVVLGAGCADPFSAKAVRASMGSIFAQPVARAPVSETPAPRVAMVAHGGEAPAPAGAEPATVCLGPEREGLPEDVLSSCERAWTIPLRPDGPESLNVAAAAAIVLGWISSARPEGST